MPFGEQDGILNKTRQKNAWTPVIYCGPPFSNAKSRLFYSSLHPHSNIGLRLPSTRTTIYTIYFSSPPLPSAGVCVDVIEPVSYASAGVMRAVATWSSATPTSASLLRSHRGYGRGNIHNAFTHLRLPSRHPASTPSWTSTPWCAWCPWSVQTRLITRDHSIAEANTKSASLGKPQTAWLEDFKCCVYASTWQHSYPSTLSNLMSATDSSCLPDQDKDYHHKYTADPGAVGYLKVEISKKPVLFLYTSDCTPEDGEFWPEVKVLCDFVKDFFNRSLVRPSFRPWLSAISTYL